MARRSRGRQSRRSREEWVALIAEQSESGLSQRAFCESRHLSVSTFSNAKRRARVTASEAEVEGNGDFLPVVVDTEVSQGKTARWDIELALGGGVVLRIRSV